MNFATAPRSFTRHRVPQLNGAFWCARSVLEGIPPVHTWGLDWPRCFRSLGVALGRARMREFELTLAQQKWLDSPIARRNSHPTVRQEAERATGAAAQPALDPGSTPGGSDQVVDDDATPASWARAY